jgi:hypothetical protein
MGGVYQELPLDEALLKRGVSRIVKQGNFVDGYTILIVVNDKTILFDVHPTRVAKWKRTMDNFTVAAMGRTG